MDWWLDTQKQASPHLEQLRVGVYATGGAPAHHMALVALWGGQPRPVYAEDIQAGWLEQFDVVVFPGGGLLAMAGQLNPLGLEGVAQMRRWVEAGGTYVGTCAGSCHPLRMNAQYQQALPEAAAFELCSITPLNTAEGSWGLSSPGTGQLRVLGNNQGLLAGLEGEFRIVHYNGPLFPAEPGSQGPLLGATSQFTPFEASLGQPGGTTTLERAMAHQAQIAFHQQVGKGQIILIGSHPEFGSSALQLGWLPAARILANAYCQVPIRGTPQRSVDPVNPQTLHQVGQYAAQLQPLLSGLLPLAHQLPNNTPPFLGYTGPQLWQAALEESIEILGHLHQWTARAPTGLRGPAFLLDTPSRPNQDFGFSGALQLLERALSMAQQAAAIPAQDWPAFTGGYNEFMGHPYHLLASVYLSTGGLVASAGLQVTAFAALAGLPPAQVVPLISPS